MNNMRELKEEDLEMFIKMFNKDFKTKIEIGNNKLLIKLYENLINQISSAPYFTEVKVDKLQELENKIKLSYNKEQKELFDEWDSLKESFFCDYRQQCFVYGYCTCKQLDIESKKEAD